MSRLDRVLDLLSYLRARELTTVATIAQDLGVSGRTVIRDLATLRDRGWPIRTEPGPGGGVIWERERAVAPIELQVEELTALWLSSQVAARLSRMPFGKAGRAGLDKILAGLPKARREGLARLRRRIVLGAPATNRVLMELGPAPPTLLSTFERAFTEGCCLALDYRDRRGRFSQRVVEPHGLLLEPPAWYLLTKDTVSLEARMFRMDRIRRPRRLPEKTFTPDFEGLRQQVARQQKQERSRR